MSNRDSALILPIKEFLEIESLSDFTGRLRENTKQTDAWNAEFGILKSAVKDYDGVIIFEYGIPGLPRVIDTVLLIDQTIFVLEFKVGESRFEPSDISQVMGYALRLKYFHSESNAREIVPILIATENKGPLDLSKACKLSTEDVYKPICCNRNALRSVLDHFLKDGPRPKGDATWQGIWADAVYSPSPSIIEATVAAWNKQNVAGLNDDDLDKEGKANHLKAETLINEIIKDSQEKGRKSIVFVTGVPGAGKTLVGLNTSITAQQYGASMLSGNGPLVAVLTEALKRNLRKHKSLDTKTDIAVESIIRLVYNYKNEIIGRMDYSTEPYKLKQEATKSCQHVIIYDEAQRAWSRGQMISHSSRSGKKPWQNDKWQYSEPEILMWDLEQLDWGVLICLVGGGQEINRGEAGLNEWFRALKENPEFKDWDIYLAPELNSAEYNTLTINGSTITEICDSMRETGHILHFNSELHLKECQRSTRAKGLSNFINLLVEGKASAKDYAEIRPYYRIYLTRDIEDAKQLIHKRKLELVPMAKVDDTYTSDIHTGVLLSSNAKRMRPLGYEVKKESEFRLKTPNWFLDQEDESIDSSNRLEVALTEFLVQGLELDLSLVLWDSDFRYVPDTNSWDFYTCNTTCGKSKWSHVEDPVKQFYMRNAYRVLLTRARSEMVICIPEGTEDDSTRLPSLYKSTYEYLKSLGLDSIDTPKHCI